MSRPVYTIADMEEDVMVIQPTHMILPRLMDTTETPSDGGAGQWPLAALLRHAAGGSDGWPDFRRQPWRPAAPQLQGNRSRPLCRLNSILVGTLQHYRQQSILFKI